TGQIGNVGRAGEVDLEQLFYSCCAAVAEAFTISLVDQELTIVDRDDVADARAGCQQVPVFVSGAGSDVDGHDAQRILWILLQFGLHDADERFAVRSDGEPLHALVRYSPRGIVGVVDFDVALRGEFADVKVRRQLKALDALPCGAIELVDIGAVFIGDEDALAVVRDPDRLGIEARVIRVPRILVRVEIIRTPGEVEFAVSILRWRSRTEPKAGAAAVDQSRRTRQQGRCGQCRGQVKGRDAPAPLGVRFIVRV